LCQEVNSGGIRGYKEVFRDSNDWFVIVGVWGVVWSPRESISTICASWAVSNLNVILFSLCYVASDARTNFMGVPVVLKVGMICNDNNWVCCSFEQIGGFQS
jgi:hypothetical protein